jgi:hypothetical protein
MLGTIVSRFLIPWFLVVATGGLWPANSQAQSAQPLSENQRQMFERAASELQSLVDKHSQRQTSEWADAALFAKGLTWALRYDREFTPADIGLMEKAIRRAQERLVALAEEKLPWTARHGKVALGYMSAVDDSVQPYGVIVPKNYDFKSPIRLDVVLHGSTRPVGMSELRFAARFDEGDGENPSPPDQLFIELHPLGRVENGYRWSGETDVFEDMVQGITATRWRSAFLRGARARTHRLQSAARSWRPLHCPLQWPYIS